MELREIIVPDWDERKEYFMSRDGKKPFHLILGNMPVVYNKEMEIEDKALRITTGVISDNTPFVAEIWRNEVNDEYLSIAMPKKYFSKRELKQLEEFIDELYSREDFVLIHHSDMIEGISDIEDEMDMLIATAYIEYLVKKKIICFVSDYEGSSVVYGNDLLGNRVALITIDMKVDGEVLAESSLGVDFPKSTFEE